MVFICQKSTTMKKFSYNIQRLSHGCSAQLKASTALHTVSWETATVSH